MPSQQPSSATAAVTTNMHISRNEITLVIARYYRSDPTWSKLIPSFSKRLTLTRLAHPMSLHYQALEASNVVPNLMGRIDAKL